MPKKVAPALDVDFAAIYREHCDRVYRVLGGLIGPTPDRDDLLQEVFVRLHRALPNFRGECAIATLLYRITVRTARDFMRARRRRPVATDGVDALFSAGPSAADRAEQREQVARARRYVERLGPDQRIAFVLREVLGWSYPEIAQAINVRPATARMRVAAATRKLARWTRKDRSDR